MNDSLMLIERMDAISPELKALLREYRPFTQLGCVTVSGDSFSYRLLEQFKRTAAGADPYQDAKLAFVIGWVSHRACDRVMKVIWKEAQFKGRGTDVDPNISPYECSVYHEGEAYRRYFTGDDDYRLALFEDDMNAFAADMDLRQDWAYTLVQGSYSANLLNIQTIPDDLDDQPRFEELCMRAQKFYVDLARYRRAISAPVPEDYEQFVSGINWYDESDPIIDAVRRIRAGETLTSETITAAVAAPAKSHYAHALALSMQYIVSANHYLHDPEADMEWLRDKLDIGRLSPEGLAV
ncbi:hypothetical protein LJC74_09050 [Eubacteriales bacterium OttesenSCG-928-A19]|nr:hypothetical protein [Eubacteriales bacterium OttesenSCG-928-A19]